MRPTTRNVAWESLMSEAVVGVFGTYGEAAEVVRDLEGRGQEMHKKKSAN
jgi:hypothetical protein